MTYAVLCPGQGAQHAGMLDLLDDSVEAQETLAAAQRILGVDLRQWLRGGDVIFDNQVAQPLICMTQLATWNALRDRIVPPMCFAGYSVGELASYGCANALDAGELARLAVQRARLMQQALGDRTGGLIAVRGLRRDVIDSLCADHALWPAINLSEVAVVLGGTLAALDTAAAAARELGGEIRCLKVGIPAHTPMLADAVDGFRHALEQSALGAPAIPVLAGIDGTRVVDRAHALDALSRQVAHTVEWARCMDALHERGCRLFLELGPGSALSRMVRERFADVEARSLDDFRSLAAGARWMESRL
jgi:[acyl-carrier-protein] S-malonyltransferase